MPGSIYPHPAPFRWSEGFAGAYVRVEDAHGVLVCEVPIRTGEADQAKAVATDIVSALNRQATDARTAKP